ncbi:hypothetical protein V8F33_007065 [Rhypophila sp. PSN 637]
MLAGINTGRLESLSVRLDQDTCTLTATDGPANWLVGLIACSKVKYLHTRDLYDAHIGNMVSLTLRSFHIDEHCMLRGRISGPEKLIRLGKNCPQLGDLHIGLTRSQGSAQEVACYATIGRHFPRLQHLALLMIPGSPTPGTAGNDDFTRRRIAREFLIDIALDGELGQSIFRVISEYRTGVERGVQLETLKLIPADSEIYSPQREQGLAGVATSFLPERWRLQRGIRDDQRDQLTATSRSSRQRCVPSFRSKHKSMQEKVDYEWDIFRGIWGNTEPNPVEHVCHFSFLPPANHRACWNGRIGHSRPLDIDGSKKLDEQTTIQA